ncbi:MAG TPA: hypothetical protein DCG75_14015 [Bacteroidales bacterium]|jgi:hypothetical protein|nr:hypothetical protein [Bacteroidales bacterium]
MIKKVLGVLAVTAIMFSCGNKEQKNTSQTAGGEEACCDKTVTKVTVDEVIKDMQAYVDKNIQIGGMVNHICAHGGKRMFIIGTDPDVAIKITPNEEIGIFEKELEGSNVLVTGTVKELRIDEEYVKNLENELASGADNEAIHDHSAGTHDEEADNEKKAQIDAMRSRIAETENGYYSQYWIEASKFEIQENDHDHEAVETEEHSHEDGEEHTH